MRKFMVWLLVLMMIISSIGAVQAENGKAGKKLTMMIYMCGSTLEEDGGCGTRDIAQMLRSGFDADEMNILVEVGGAKRWRMGYDTKSLTTLEVGGRKPTEVRVSAGANMGEAQTLTDFLNYGVENYPAEEYVLIMWDHGGGPLGGVCMDTLYKGDTLTLPELDQALAASPFAETKLSWIGFDTCLMATVETACCVAPYAHYMIASEEVTFGYSYAFLKDMMQDANPVETGKRLSSATFDMYAATGKKQGVSLTMSVIDLARIAAVEQEMDSYFADMAVKLNDDTYPSVAKARKEARAFGYEEKEAGNVDTVDIGALINYYGGEGAEKLKAAIDDAVVYHVGMAEDNCGLSVYHPFYNKEKAVSNVTEYSKLGFSGGYTNYVQRFTSILTGEPLATWENLNTGNDKVQKDNRTLFNLALTEEQQEQLAVAELMALRENKNGTYSLAFDTRNTGVDESGKVLIGSFDGTALYAVDAGGVPVTGPLPYTIDENGMLHIAAHGVADATSERPAHENDLILICEVKDKKLTPVSLLAKSDEEEAFTSRYGFALADFDDITLIAEEKEPSRDANGTLTAYSAWETVNTESWTVKAEDLALVLLNDTIDKAELQATFQLYDLQWNAYSSELLPMQGAHQDGLITVDYDDGGLVMIDALTCSVVENAVALSAKVTNLNENENIVYVDNLTIAGVPVDADAAAYGTGENWGLLQNETQMLNVMIPADALEGIDTVESITFDLVLADAESDETVGTVPVAITLNLAVSVLH